MPEAAQIRNPRLLAALSAILRQSGVEFRENIQVQGFTAQRGRLTTLRTSHGEIKTHRCLVCTGAWSGDLLKAAGLELPITPVKGQMLLLSAQSLDIKTMIIKDYRYIIPRRDGRVLVLLRIIPGKSPYLEVVGCETRHGLRLIVYVKSVFFLLISCSHSDYSIRIDPS